MIRRPPQKIIVENEVAASPMMQTLRRRLPQIQVTVVDRIPDNTPVRSGRARGGLVQRPIHPAMPRHASLFLLWLPDPARRHPVQSGLQLLYPAGLPESAQFASVRQYRRRFWPNSMPICAPSPTNFTGSAPGNSPIPCCWIPWTEFSRQLVPFFARTAPRGAGAENQDRFH